jgi:hypothetical protein
MQIRVGSLNDMFELSSKSKYWRFQLIDLYKPYEKR